MHIAAALLAMVIAGANSQLIESQSSSITLTTTNVDSLPAALTVPVKPEMTHVNVQITADIGASPVSQSVSLAGASSVPQLTVTAADIADIGAPPLQQKLITSSSSSVGAGHVEAAQSSPMPSVDAFTQFQLFTQQTAEKFNSSDNSTTSIPMQSTQPAVENSSRTTISTSITHVEPSLFATLQTLASTSIAQSLSSTSTSTSTSTSIPSSASQQGSLSPQITTSMQPIETQVSGSSLGQVLESDIPVPKTPKENNKVPVPPQPQVNNPKTVPSSQNSIAVPSNTTINPLASPITVSPVDGGNKGNDKSKAKSVSQQLPSSPVDHQASLAAAVAIEADGPSITVNPTQEPAPTQPIDTIQKKNVIGGLLRDNSMIDDTADEAGSSDKRQQRAKPLPLVNSYRPGQTGGGEIKNGVKSFLKQLTIIIAHSMNCHRDYR
jgi:hypothetical protein